MLNDGGQFLGATFPKLKSHAPELSCSLLLRRQCPQFEYDPLPSPTIRRECSNIDRQNDPPRAEIPRGLQNRYRDRCGCAPLTHVLHASEACGEENPAAPQETYTPNMTTLISRGVLA